MARTFNGSSDKAVVTATPVSAYGVTLALWLKPNALNTARGVFGLSDGTNSNRLQLNTGSGGSAGQMRAIATPGGIAVSTLAWTDAVWTHFCAVFASTTSRACFTNGANKGTNATSGAFPTGLNSVQAGVDSTNAGGFSAGDFAELAVWNIALTDAEVALLGSTTTPISPLLMHPESLVFYAPLLTGQSPEVEIMKGNSFTLTGTSVAAHTRIDHPSRHGRFRYGVTAAGGASGQPYRKRMGGIPFASGNLGSGIW